MNPENRSQFKLRSIKITLELIMRSIALYEYIGIITEPMIKFKKIKYFTKNAYPIQLYTTAPINFHTYRECNHPAASTHLRSGTRA